MNTEFIITVYTSEPNLSDSLVETAFNEINLLIKKYSRFNNSSELTILNNSKIITNEISEEMYNFCNYGLKLGKLTDGVFDFTIVDLLHAIGYSKSYKESNSFSQLDIDEIGKLIKTRKTYRDVKVSKKNNSFYLTKPIGCMLDFGGFLKGYAVDLIWEILKPLKNYLVDAGGDIRCNGSAFKNGQWSNWIVGLWNFDKAVNEYIKLESGNCITCSGANSKKFGELHHLVNPRKIKYEKDYRLTFVHGKNLNIKLKIPGINFPTPTTICDTYSTISFVIGKDILQSLPRGLDVIFK